MKEPVKAMKPEGVNPLKFIWGQSKGALRVLGFAAMVLLLAVPQMIKVRFNVGDAFSIPLLFHSILMRLMGFRVRIHGKPSEQKPVLFVSNHASYLDIPVLGSILKVSFIAKSEVANWPLFGWLAKLQNTSFVERRPARAREQRDDLRNRVLRSDNLLIFAEGTSSSGAVTLPFKTSLFSIAKESFEGNISPVVQPVSIVCSEYKGRLITDQDVRDFYAWYKADDYLIPHLWKMFTLGGFTIDVVFHPVINPADFPDRKALAEYCHKRVSEGVEKCVAGKFSKT